MRSHLAEPVRTWTSPVVVPVDGRSDREMFCPACRYRAFTSLAPELIAQGRSCPACDGPLMLSPR